MRDKGKSLGRKRIVKKSTTPPTIKLPIADQEDRKNSVRSFLADRGFNKNEIRVIEQRLPDLKFAIYQPTPGDLFDDTCAFAIKLQAQKQLPVIIGGNNGNNSLVSIVREGDTIPVIRITARELQEACLPEEKREKYAADKVKYNNKFDSIYDSLPTFFKATVDAVEGEREDKADQLLLAYRAYQLVATLRSADAIRSWSESHWIIRDLLVAMEYPGSSFQKKESEASTLAIHFLEHTPINALPVLPDRGNKYFTMDERDNILAGKLTIDIINPRSGEIGKIVKSAIGQANSSDSIVVCAVLCGSKQEIYLVIRPLSSVEDVISDFIRQRNASTTGMLYPT